MLEKKYKIRFNGLELELEETAEGIKIDDQIFQPRVERAPKGYQVFIDGQEFKVEYKEEGIFLNGKEIDFDFAISPKILARKSKAGKKGAEIKAAIPGKIVEVRVEVNEEVKDQQCLLVLESMKMQNEILSPMEGIIESILVKAGDQVTSKQLLIKIKAKDISK